jgi:hypothetical protein
MSIISVGTTLTTGLSLESDTTGNLVIKTGASGVTAATFNSGGTAVIGNLSATSAVISNLSVTSASISTLSVTSITLSGVLPIAQGGTGLSSTPTNGQLLIGNGTGFTLATLTGGSGVTVTNNAGSISLSAAGLPAVVVTSSTSISAAANNHYVLTSATAATVTLPASPTLSDTIYVTVGNGLTTNVIARNGKNIQGLAEDMTLNSTYASAQLRFTNDATEGWVLA